MEVKPDYKALIELAYARMYFGKYKDYYLSEIPEYYLIWFQQKGFPEGKLGDQLRQVTDLKVNGMEHILRTIRSKYPKNQ
ncbi:DUF3820 family protein [Antarcticibacterium sp. 1MA-6-2]|uniref:DUF3820 family protein n=1 Tax=Antarcticibacterium sp. 1MA-6-2 TaxID=2908210 RepID=UPI001F1F9220|nr:DUF3820 family protein [Antarcticibacterium sp. 1MA-6-2]UJH92237.1 DUF3820 family protein [Antarcticibacterium sp. 1MA-6-2]